jgi:hypothetical protein
VFLFVEMDAEQVCATSFNFFILVPFLDFISQILLGI